MKVNIYKSPWSSDIMIRTKSYFPGLNLRENILDKRFLFIATKWG